MEPVKIAQYGDNKGLDLLQTMDALDKRNMRPLDIFESDQRLVHSDLWKSEKEMYPCRVGPFVAYQKCGEPLGKSIELEGWNVIVPKKFQEEENIALVSPYADLKRKGKVILSGSFSAIQLPPNDGWYETEKKFGLPIGKKKDYADSRRYLWRWQDNPYVGLLSRDYGDLGY